MLHIHTHPYGYYIIRTLNNIIFTQSHRLCKEEKNIGLYLIAVNKCSYICFSKLLKPIKKRYGKRAYKMFIKRKSFRAVARYPAKFTNESRFYDNSIILLFYPFVFYFCTCLLYTSPSPRDKRQSRMPSSA